MIPYFWLSCKQKIFKKLKLGIDKYCTCMYYNYCTGDIQGGDLMSPAGRPKIDNPRNVRLEIRLTQAENEMLESCAEKLSATKTDVIVKGIEKVNEELNKK